jgi:hypothetical protein
MIGYPLFLVILGRALKNRVNKKDYSLQPSVTIMVVAHNEEKVILEKLKNIISLQYPKNKIHYLVTSDNSTDLTNEIVLKFINENPDHDIKLYVTKKRMGKTNAQNEAQKTVETEFLVMTDANSIIDTNALIELMSSFITENIAYVCGKLMIINDDVSETSNLESNYWDLDLALRKIESNIQTITAGNGALYAVRNDDYHDFNPVESHDSAMPLHYALNNKRAIYNENAKVYEKAGEIIQDEFKRKVRMNRMIIKHILPTYRLLNIFKYHWFTIFYIGHRSFRYSLWFSHLVIFITNAFLINSSYLYLILFAVQCLFYLLVLVKIVTKSKNKVISFAYYYFITMIAQWVGVYRILSGKAKPFWEKAESTR